MKIEILNTMQGLLSYMLVLTAQLVLILFLRKPIRKTLGANTSYALWALPLLWLPFYSIGQNFLKWLSFSETTSNNTVLGASQYFPNSLQFNISFPSLTTLIEQTSYSSFTTQLTWSLIVVWMSGALLLGFSQFMRAKKFNKSLKQSALPIPLPQEYKGHIDCFQVKDLHSPAIAGLWKPILLLPEDFLTRFNTDQRHLVLAHEAVHANRWDNLWNLLAEVYQILFWFNPIIHIAKRTFHLDQEMSCDALALRQCTKKQQQCFARTLLVSAKHSIHPPQPVILTGWNNLTELKERSLMIQHHIKRKPCPLFSVSILMVLGLSGAACTSSVNSAERSSYNTQSRTLTHSVYSVIEEVMESREKKDYEDAMERLSSLKERYEAGGLNTYESYITWIFDASIKLDQENYDSSLSSWNKVLEYSGGEDQSVQALKSIGQIHLTQEDFVLAIDSLLQAKDLSDEPSSNLEFQIATSYYQIEEFQNALPFAQSVLDIKGDEATRQDYVFLRHLHENLNNETKVEELTKEIGILFDSDN